MDRRIINTHTQVLHSLLDMTTNCDANAVRVVNLCDKAGINKSTFYLHYESLADCVEKCKGYFVTYSVALANQINYEAAAANPQNLVKAICKFAQDNVISITKLMNSTMYNTVVDMVADSVIEAICKNNNIEKDAHHQYTKLSFLVYGTIGALKNSIAINGKVDADELSRVLMTAIKRA